MAYTIYLVMKTGGGVTPDGTGMGIHWHIMSKVEYYTTDPLSQIIPEFDLSQSVVIEKSQYDAFYQTRLEEILQQKGVRQLVICGVMTHLCCETTARSAFTRGFEVFFTIDGTATQNEAFHRATLLNLAHGFAVPVLVEEVIRAIKGESLYGEQDED